MCPRPTSVEEDTPSALLPSPHLSSPHLFSPVLSSPVHSSPFLYCPLLSSTVLTCYCTAPVSPELHITCTSLRYVIHHRKSERKMMRTKSTTGEEGKGSNSSVPVAVLLQMLAKVTSPAFSPIRFSPLSQLLLLLLHCYYSMYMIESPLRSYLFETDGRTDRTGLLFFPSPPFPSLSERAGSVPVPVPGY
jgi:hypothetical protein